MKSPFITQLKYCQKLDFEADPFNRFKTLIIKKIVFFDVKINIQFPVLTRFQYCQKLDIEAGPNNKFKTLIWKKHDFKINEISFYNAFKYCQKLDFEAGPSINLKP